MLGISAAADVSERQRRDRSAKGGADVACLQGACDESPYSAMDMESEADISLIAEKIVHEYGDICQSVTAIAVEQNGKISADEFRTLNRCLDDATADAVTSFGRARQTSFNDQARSLRDRLSAFSDEHGRLMDIATQAYSAIRTGNVGLSGAACTLLTHTLSELRSLGERTLSEIHPENAASSSVSVR
jgi:hypothetical protein